MTIEIGNKIVPRLQSNRDKDHKEIYRFQIFKETTDFAENTSGTEDEKIPLVSLNILAQMVYEVVEKVNQLNPQPIVILLRKNIVKGVGRPGMYGFDFTNETLVPIESLGVEEWNRLKEQSKSSLALGFGLLGEDQNSKLTQETIIKGSEGVKKEMKRILELHGDLEDIVAENPVGISKLPLAYLHWIKGKNTL
ncbi:hypothetical protein QTG56_07445 [Rossellomorea sp. AcN35-11]|nr:hypothetical protein [Rossellomorea aquimaris]WJV30848.1 hypothetical protein QTG56_07445 [Rossellomorea sp. AcN35-11]